MKTGIVICVFNRRETVEPSIDSILADAPADTKVVIVDDVSTDGARELLQKYVKRCEIILNERNIGLCAAANRGFDACRRSGCRDVIRINSDIKVERGWFKSITSVAALPNIGVVGISVHNVLGPETWGAHRVVGTPGSAEHSERRWLIGHCMLLTYRVLETGFRWDERIYPVGMCDVDVCCFSLSKGLRNVIAHGARSMILPCQPSLKYSKHGWCSGVVPQKWPTLYKEFTEYSLISVSVVIPTSGRPSLKLSIMSAINEGLARKTDEILVCSDGPSDFARSMCRLLSSKTPVRYFHTPTATKNSGNSQRELGMKAAKGTHLAFLDDDDAYAPGALKTIRSVIGQQHDMDKILMFRIKHSGQGVIWKDPKIRLMNVSTQNFIVPNNPAKLGIWRRPCPGDFDFITSTIAKRGESDKDVVWREEVIAHHNKWRKM